jgi:3'-phosphoadenosine 5'-phosphosulfate sulfotransferase (PAPS reductase)/FAD synthetase
MSDHILSLSYGKDSLACLGAIEELGWPLDRIVHAEVWATDTIPADLPPMVEFKAKADRIIKERWGIEVEHIKTKPYEHYFYQQRTSDRKDHPNSIWGFPFQQGAWCNSRCKVRPLNSANKDGIVYVGIAADADNHREDLFQARRGGEVLPGERRRFPGGVHRQRPRRI